MRKYTGPRADKITALSKLADIVLSPRDARKFKLELKRKDRKELEATERRFRNSLRKIKKK